MDPTSLIPIPDPIPVPWGWFQFFLLLTFFLHILAMNIMLGSAFIAMVSHFRSKSDQSSSLEISKSLPFAIAFAVNFGVAPLLFAQVLYGHLLYTSSILMAVFWLWIVGIIILAYYLAYLYKYQFAKLNSGRALITLAIVFLLMLVGFFFTNNMTLMLHPQEWIRYFKSPGGLLLNLGDSTLIPRYLHFMVSAVAIGGLAMALFFSYKKSRGDANTQGSIENGCKWFAYATMVNIAVGMWFFASLPDGLIEPNTFSGLLFITLMILGIFLAILAAVYAMAFRIMAAIHCALATLILMILVRDMLRTAYLNPWFKLSELQVSPAYSPFILFLLFFIAGLILIGWMLKLAFEALDNKEVQS